jgi:amino acid adenylation domain-containing protein
VKHVCESTSIQRALEAQAAQTPQGIAVSFNDQTLCYSDLNQRANQLAHYLRRAGVTSGTHVALFLERSLDMVVAIAAVIKAGGAYVPIDLAYPQQRQAFMLEDAEAPVVITQSSLVESMPQTAARKICLDTEAAAITSENSENPENKTTGNDIAYIIYTSGSTGKPKGVRVTHNNVLRLFTKTNHWYRFNSKDVWTLFHSYAFDFSVWEIWGALLYGGRLVVVPYLVSRSPNEFYELLEREGVTVLNQTPSAFRNLIRVDEQYAQANGKGRNLNLRYVVFGGEALPLQSLAPWFARHGDQTPTLVNMYGITETTVHVTYRVIRQNDLDAKLGSVIGVPIPDLELFLLDDNLKPVPDGCPGEICVGGDGVAAGYLKRPELTAQRFVANPFSSQPHARLYRSGDLARRLPDGDLEYLGRKDQQVKIRGFRIELEEIQTVLLQHPAVREGAVTAKADGDQQRLVAYVALKSKENSVSISELRGWLGRQLPEYMIPSAFVFVDALPLTLNGKIDWKSLPEPDSQRPTLAQAFVAPESAEEKALATVWQEVLGIERVGVNDNFFELGGDSIRSIRVLVRAGEEGLAISLEDLFAKPTIRELAAATRFETKEAKAEATQKFERFALVSEADRAKLPADLEDAYPMTQLQVGMVFHSDYDPSSAIFHDVFSFRINMAFDEAALRESVRLLVNRHPIFRTSFDLAKYSRPLQLLHRDAQPEITIKDLRNFSADDQRQRLVKWVETEKRRAFDWSVAPMMRLHVQRYTDKAFQIVVSFHHIIMDGWSLAAMLTELFQDYAGWLEGEPKNIASPKSTYRDFVALEQEAINSQQTAQFWKQKLDNAPVQLLPRWPKAMRAGGREQVRGPEIIFPKDVFEGLQRLANSMRVPLRTVLLAAHCRVMSVLTGQTDVVTGLVSNGRPQAVDGEKIIGLFLNTIPLRANVNGGSWKELITQTFAAEKELLPHRRCPLSTIQQLSGGHALFETAFDFVQFHVYRDIPGYGERTFLEDYYFEANNFTFYATFMLDASASELQMHFDYNPNLLCAEQIRLMCDYYSNALAAIARTPDEAYEKLSLLPASETKFLVEDWNNTSHPIPNVCAHELFEAQAQKTPKAAAAVFGDKGLTYEQLNRDANNLSAHLSQLGISRGARVGIQCERSLEMLVSVLGVLKSGAAYVPLDPSFPQERLDFMRADGELSAIITQQKFSDTIAATGVETICAEKFVGTQTDSQKPQSAVKPDDIAYTIYTSGSTGKPKGTQISHRALVNFLATMQQRPGIAASDVLLAVTTISFDIAGLELVLPLTVGATVVIAPSKTVTDFNALAELMRSSNATMMQATPTTWRGLIETGWKGNKSLKVLCGGEALPPKLAGEILSRCSELWNMYGPTETTIWSTVHRVTSADEAAAFEADATAIGQPIGNTDVYIVDAQFNLVPTGSEGEICIGGDGLARGYFKRDELTSEKFVKNPFKPGARMYRTGDVGRWLPDPKTKIGTLLYNGRRDQQVKIRGFRIELGEIENALAKHPAVASAVVAAKTDQAGSKQLVGYWIPRPGTTKPSSSELREFLEQSLPAQMVPTVCVELERMPLTPNGKIDRKSLPDPGTLQRDSGREYVAPSTPFESMLAEIWRDVLHIDRVGVTDNFLQLGGHSLVAIQVVSRVCSQFGVDISAGQFFEHPTIKEFAVLLVEQLMKVQNGSAPQVAVQAA